MKLKLKRREKKNRGINYQQEMVKKRYAEDIKNMFKQVCNMEVVVDGIIMV